MQARWSVRRVAEQFVNGRLVEAVFSVAEVVADDDFATFPERGIDPVSYTHLDVYKRQVLSRADVRPTHPRANDPGDPLHAARAAEVTSLWRLGVK